WRSPPPRRPARARPAPARGRGTHAPPQPSPSAGAPGGPSIANSTGTRTRPATGSPSFIAGLNVQFFTASSVAWSNTPAGSDFSTRAPDTLPSAATSTISTTRPVTRADTASAGYLGGASIFDWTSTCAPPSARTPACCAASTATARSGLPWADRSIDRGPDTGAAASAPATTVVAGRAAQTAQAEPATNVLAMASPASTRRGPGTGRLSMAILSLSGWPPNQWQARGAGIADSWVLTMASP